MNPPARATVHAFATGAELLARAEPFLHRREVEHAWHLGAVRRITASAAAQTPYLALVEIDEDIAAVTFRTPPHHLALSHVEPAHRVDAFEALVHDLREREVTLPGVFGPQAEAEDFASRWARATGVVSRVAMAMREFALERVVPPAPVEGTARRATMDELELLHAWSHAFIDETGLPEADRVITTRDAVSARIAGAGYWLWCIDEAPRAMVFLGGTSRLARIGPVYTPPAWRRRGLASALVAVASQRALDEGAHRVCLATDRANPTANAIYQALGYRPIGDRAMIAFEPVT